MGCFHFCLLTYLLVAFLNFIESNGYMTFWFFCWDLDQLGFFFVFMYIVLIELRS